LQPAIHQSINQSINQYINQSIDSVLHTLKLIRSSVVDRFYITKKSQTRESMKSKLPVLVDKMATVKQGRMALQAVSSSNHHLGQQQEQQQGITGKHW
jgi:hypothetical protein